MAEVAPANVHRKAHETAAHLRASLPEELSKPIVAIICGTGLGGLVDSINPKPRYEAAYSETPNFPISSVQGHAGKLVFGTLGFSERPAVLMVGRAHFYEGHSIASVTFPVRVFKLLGVQTIIVTNAAGGLNEEYAVGDVVVLNDHLNLAGLAGIHPLRGPNAEDFGVRFPPLSDAYDLELRRLAHRSWKSLGLARTKRRIHEGVYAFVGGPTYETRAECRLLRGLGADVVGMSTVPEIIVARHCGLKVFALSLVTNNAVLAAGPKGNDALVESASGGELDSTMEVGKANHEEVIEAGREAAKDVQALVEAMVQHLPLS